NPVPTARRRAHKNREPLTRSRELEVRAKNIDSQRVGVGEQDWHLFNDGQFLLPSALQRRLPSTFHDSRTCGSEPAILRSTFLARMTADTSGTQIHLSHSVLSASLSYGPLWLVLAEDGTGDGVIARRFRPNRKQSHAATPGIRLDSFPVGR